MKSIADKKKKENIIEYILYLYRMEDLLRAYQFDMKEVNEYVLGHKNVQTEDKEETKLWLSGMIQEMEQEGIQEKGHLQKTQKLVDHLAKIHWQLLKEETEYIAVYRKTQPHLLQLIAESQEDVPEHEIQIFINTLYGILLSKLNGHEIPEDIMNAASSFGDTLALLNHAYMSGYEAKTE
ncbi:DUF4924 family protein [Cyclobacterium sp. 1_MG-2023]|uniref:DUF4924 family protein n=1 Tax=Cyclobacterium sp. 1_MG-2023 TaxID=3062681 RepID=UPI0026E393CC|nr:DUF4924 family protein [Cyclobacterium sp. 1_MG-2023]MDO6440094.1 DUF4924 family protein [Cyclobacterium sp. 1_MG-2023]